MENKTRINWIAVAVGFAVALVIAVLLLPSTRWIALAAHRQYTGEKDLWNIGPHRIQGEDPDAELARILLTRDYERTHTLLTDFVDHSKPRADALAHWCRQSFISIPRDELGQPYQSVESAENNAQYAQMGAALEPDNAYWPLVEAAHWALADDFESTAAALHRAKDCTTYDDYALAQADLIIEQLQEGRERLTITGETIIVSSVYFPHASIFKHLAEWLPEDAVTARGDLALVSVTVARDSSTVIMVLISQAMARYAFLPDLRSLEQPYDEKLASALDILVQDRPEDAAALSDALKLAAADRPEPTVNDDQVVFDIAIEGVYLKRFTGWVLWLVASAVMVFIGPQFSRLFNFPKFARFAPFIGFLLLGWAAIPRGTRASEHLLLLEWHVPEIAVIGIVLGFVALNDKYTKIARWVCLALTLVLLPLAVQVPVLALILATIWVTFALPWRKHDRWPTTAIAAVAPCLLTLPIAINHIADLDAGVYTMLIVLSVLAIPLAWCSKNLAKRSQWAAVSILIPCLFIVATIRMNISADAAVGTILENEFKQVEQYRDALTP